MGVIRTSATSEFTTEQNNQNTAENVHNLAGVIEDEINSQKPFGAYLTVQGETGEGLEFIEFYDDKIKKNVPYIVQVYVGTIGVHRNVFQSFQPTIVELEYGLCRIGLNNVPTTETQIVVLMHPVVTGIRTPISNILEIL